MCSAGSIGLALLREEQERITKESREVEDRLRAADDTLTEWWQETLELAIRLVTNCARTYARSKEKSRRMLNGVVFERLYVVEGAIRQAVYRPPFDFVLRGEVAPSAEALPVAAAAASGGVPVERVPIRRLGWEGFAGLELPGPPTPARRGRPRVGCVMRLRPLKPAELATKSGRGTSLRAPASCGCGECLSARRRLACPAGSGPRERRHRRRD
jgi:hypothetical protein